MPFYEYQCRTCSAHHEAMQKMSDAPLKKCPACGRNTLQRLISAPVFRLKGGGWYETDFKSDAETKRNLAVAEKGEKSDGGEKAASPDAKPDAKGDMKGDAKADGANAKPAPAAAAPAKPVKSVKPPAAPLKTARARPSKQPAAKRRPPAGKAAKRR